MTKPLNVMIVDDEPKMGKILSRILAREGHQTVAYSDPHIALKALDGEAYDLMVTDLKMPGMDGLELMDSAREKLPNLDVVMMTAYATAETAVKAMKQGAFDYLIKPFPNEELVMVVARVAETRGLREENQLLKKTLKGQFQPENIVAVSPSMREVLKRAEKVAVSNVSVLLRGASGTGKEVLAMAIHRASERHDQPLVKVNCGALPETLLESELFGHVRGAFTGAIETRKGLFQQADGGTIFLDEIGEISPPLQVKLLRVLQAGEFQRVGDAQTFRVDVRVIAATHRNLEEMIGAGQFRSDLYYRLNVVPIEIPPLKDRPEDVPALIDHFLARLRKRNQRTVTLAPDAYFLLQSYEWPGNIRELENALEYAYVMCEDGAIQILDLPIAVQNAGSTLLKTTAMPNLVSGGALTLEEIEKQVLTQALEATGYNHTRAAQKLGITRRTLGYRLAKFDLPRRNPKKKPFVAASESTQSKGESA